MGETRELVELAKKVLKVLKSEVEEKGLNQKLSITEEGQEGKSKVITSCIYLEERFQECSKRGVVQTTIVETLGVGLGTKTQQLEAKEKARRKKVRGEMLTHQVK